jgi:hypothetical protein
LVFTCHEHIARMFQSLRVEVHELPEHGRAYPATPVARKTAAKPSRRKATEEASVEVVATGEEDKPIEAGPEEVVPPSPPVVEEPRSDPMEALPPWEADDSEPADPFLAARNDEGGEGVVAAVGISGAEAA